MKADEAEVSSATSKPYRIKSQQKQKTLKLTLNKMLLIKKTKTTGGSTKIM